MLHQLRLVVAFASLAVASSALACSGDACRDITIKTDPKGCVFVQNRGMRGIRVRLGSDSLTVRGGDTAYLRGTSGRCISGYVGSASATYTD